MASALDAPHGADMIIRQADGSALYLFKTPHGARMMYLRPLSRKQKAAAKRRAQETIAYLNSLSTNKPRASSGFLGDIAFDAVCAITVGLMIGFWIAVIF
jgi:hypothetical protein